MSVKTDMQPGERYGRLVVINPAVAPLKAWVRCDCGTEKVVRRMVLRNGTTVSCGCVRKENMIAHGSAKRKHGLRSHPLWNLWEQRKLACQNPNHPSFKWYGARGVKMYAPWVQDFALFLRDIGEAPPGMRLTRKDSAGDFAPGNVHWTPQSRAHW